jgi:hypothetical protein
MRRPDDPGYSDMSDLLWYFERPSTGTFPSLKYLDFFRRFYLNTEAIGRPLSERQTFIAHINTERGPRQKILVERLPGNWVVTRLQTVPVREKELFYFRALLRERPATSFQDLRTVEGVTYRLYQDAATALGLFQDMHESEYAMTDAIAAYAFPSQLRFLFANMLVDMPSPRDGTVDAIPARPLCRLLATTQRV